MREGAVSSLELVETYLRRIERLDPALNAYVTVCSEEALAAARAPRPGPFSGVPLPIKDLTETAGIRTTHSSRAFADYVPERDVELMRRVRDAGFVVLGKTNTPEFGTTAVDRVRPERDLPQPVGSRVGRRAARAAAPRRPWRPGSRRSPTARTAAARSASRPRAAGSSGSSRRAAGSRPRRSATSTGSSTNGSLARTVADAAAFLDVVAGPEPGDPYVAPPPERPFAEEVGAPPGRLRVALVLEPPHPSPVDAACVEAARDAATLLAELGHEVEEVAAAVAERRADRPVRRALADDPVAVSGRPGAVRAAQPGVRRARRDHVERGLRARLRPPPALRSRGRGVLRDRRPRAHADARAAAGPGRLGDGARRPVGAVRAGGGVHAVHGRGQRRRAPGDVGAAPLGRGRHAARGAADRPAAPARRSSCGWPRSSRRRGRGRLAGRPSPRP